MIIKFKFNNTIKYDDLAFFLENHIQLLVNKIIRKKSFLLVMSDNKSNLDH